MESDVAVRDILTTAYVGVNESDTVQGAVQLMREERLGCVLVVRGSTTIGIVTEWDVLGLVADGGDPVETTVGEIMSQPVISIGPEMSVTEASARMTRENVRNLVVETNGETHGILTQRDVIAAAGSFTATAMATGNSSEPMSTPSDDRLNAEAGSTEADEYSTQGVCEDCGSLADTLWNANGKLVCMDCRSV